MTKPAQNPTRNTTVYIDSATLHLDGAKRFVDAATEHP